MFVITVSPDLGAVVSGLACDRSSIKVPLTEIGREDLVLIHMDTS
jgi:hypothetical protein